VTNLAGAFFLAGADTVLLSPVDLEFTATMALTNVFHERLRVHGESPARAMMEARRALAREGPYTHPYYTSMVQVLGLGHRARFEPLAASAPLPSRNNFAPLARVTLLAVLAAGAVALAWRARPRSRS
jgi:hypothetical protein